MSDMLEFMVANTLAESGEDFYHASNGIRLVLAADGESLWISINPEMVGVYRYEDVNNAMVEYLKK